MKQITYKGTPIRLSAYFSTETLQARREWHNIFKVMKGKNLQLRIFYPARLSFRFDGEIKSFPDKQKLIEFSTIKLALQQMLKELLQAGNTRKGKDVQKINSKQLIKWQQDHESESEVAQSCPTLCDPMDCSPPVSSVHGISQARILEWVAVSLSKQDHTYQ